MSTRITSVNSLLLYVQDVAASASFYAELGFEVHNQNAELAVVGLHGFTLQLVSKEMANSDEFRKEALAELKGSGLYIYIEVENVDEYYSYVVGKNMKVSSEPRDWPWGKREFVLRDLDGYKLVFYAKI